VRPDINLSNGARYAIHSTNPSCKRESLRSRAKWREPRLDFGLRPLDSLGKHLLDLGQPHTVQHLPPPRAHMSTPREVAPWLHGYTKPIAQCGAS
jgi:hypothetical protein